jgi:phosphoglycolate phosphatase
MEKTMRPEYIFMDLDGTISDPKEGITKAVAHALSYYGIQVENLDTLER